MKNFFYLTLNEDRTWSCSVAETEPSAQAALLVQEGAYPTEMYYTRADLNGSSVMESVACKDREDLKQCLNWVGQIGGTVESLWDFDHKQPILTELADIFRAGREMRAEEAYAMMKEAFSFD